MFQVKGTVSPLEPAGVQDFFQSYDQKKHCVGIIFLPQRLLLPQAGNATSGTQPVPHNKKLSLSLLGWR